jgi:hypothetical protein
LPVSFISCAFERADNLGAYRIPPETGLLIPSDFINYVIELYTWGLVAWMGRVRLSQIFLNVAYYLLISCVAEFRPLIIGGFFKVVASLVFACLLAFVVVHSPDIYKLVADCLRPLAIPLFSLVVDRRWADRSQTNIVVTNEPSLSRERFRTNI